MRASRQTEQDTGLPKYWHGPTDTTTVESTENELWDLGLRYTLQHSLHWKNLCFYF